MTNKENAEQVTQIDENHLDRECIKLPSDYRRFAFAAAEAKKDVQEVKANLDVVQAELAKEIRTNPEKFGLEKVTEAALGGVVILQPRFQEAQKSFFKAQYNQEMCQAVVWALEHKKRALTLLVELHGMGYFSDVKVSAEGKEAVEKMMQAKVRRRHQNDD